MVDKLRGVRSQDSVGGRDESKGAAKPERGSPPGSRSPEDKQADSLSRPNADQVLRKSALPKSARRKTGKSSSSARLNASSEAKEALIRGYNSFTINLFDQLFALYPGKNIFITIGIASGLLSIYNGADGTTRHAVAKALGLQGMNTEEANAAHAEVVGTLSKKKAGAQLQIANCLLVDKKVRLREDFLQRFSGEVIHHLGLTSPQMSTFIKEWVAEKTDNQVTDFDPSGDFNTKTLLALLTPAHFRGLWDIPFDRRDTKPGLFMSSTGKRKGLPFMFREGSFHHDYQDDHELIRLHYKHRSISMRVFLPRVKHTLADVQHTLKDVQWDPGHFFQDLSRQFHNMHDLGEDKLYFPKFKVESETDLTVPLAKLGMSELFTPMGANLSRMIASPLPAHFGQAIQKGVLEVDEEGTTASDISSFAASLGEPSTIKVNRPFLTSVVHNKSNLILGLGSVVDPLANGNGQPQSA